MDWLRGLPSRGDLQQAQVERVDNGSLTLTTFRGQRVRIEWPLLGLAQAPDCTGGDAASMRWKLHFVNPDSGVRDFQSGDRNRWDLVARAGHCIYPERAYVSTGVLEVCMRLQRTAVLDLTLSSTGLPMQLHLAEPLSICLEHRQSWDKGAGCICGRNLVRRLRDRRYGGSKLTESEAYAAKWGSMIEMESAASAIESNDSRFLCDAYVQWGLPGGGRRGSFNIPVSLARAHKLKFRGLIQRGGEGASGWFCMRENRERGANRPAWAGHAHIVQAGIIGEGLELGVDDEDALKAVDGRRSITVVFQMLDEVSDPGEPQGNTMLIEYIPKALSHSMQHLAIGEVNAALPKDGSERPKLLARDVVLDRLEPCAEVDKADLASWQLNASQDEAVRRALARPLMLVHGPPGTGKTHTAAVFMTMLAQRNLGARCATLFAAPTNRACDTALYATNKLCEKFFAERLRARVEEDGDDDCAICLDGQPDVVTACGHVFHRACLQQSLGESSKCPLCRQVLKQHQGGLRILRVYGADSEREDFPVPKKVDHRGIQTFKAQTVPVEMRRFTLHWRCHAAVQGEEPSAEALKVREAYERLRSANVRANNFDELRAIYYEALTKARAVEVHQSDIIFTTCVSARRTALQAALEAEGAPEIRQVVLDEAGQAPEPEALCPLALPKKARQAILFGDHKQLRPILRSKLAEEAGLGISLFERLALKCYASEEQAPVYMLAEQYRMHPGISRFPNDQFYKGRVADHTSVEEREDGLLRHPRTGKQAACLLWDGAAGDGSEQLQRVRTVGAGGVGSRSNALEAERAVELASRLARAAGQSAVAVLSWYNNQVAKISEALRRQGLGGVHVGSIATAQGSQWDYVILSAVRSGPGGGSLGLVADAHNLNVALTRAKIGMVVLCDTAAVQRNVHWGALISHYKERRIMVTERPVVDMVPRRPPSPKRRSPSPELVVLSGAIPGLAATVAPPPARGLAGGGTCAKMRLRAKRGDRSRSRSPSSRSGSGSGKDGAFDFSGGGGDSSSTCSPMFSQQGVTELELGMAWLQRWQGYHTSTSGVAPYAAPLHSGPAFGMPSASSLQPPVFATQPASNVYSSMGLGNAAAQISPMGGLWSGWGESFPPTPPGFLSTPSPAAAAIAPISAPFGGPSAGRERSPKGVAAREDERLWGA
eukprot:TRINITY_DN64969_c0_g1_i1.p1 TRINITY_DN64969_c0_g1~~TRINITY_DN64969_c0_g1_i1.p1  ORF type:complete len:1171 (-),score=202.59 TRINITY_DN64969_c0_g1_i1:154-3666(-)